MQFLVYSSCEYLRSGTTKVHTIMCASHIWFPTPTPGWEGISPVCPIPTTRMQKFLFPTLGRAQVSKFRPGNSIDINEFTPGIPGGRVGHQIFEAHIRDSFQSCHHHHWHIWCILMLEKFLPCAPHTLPSAVGITIMGQFIIIQASQSIKRVFQKEIKIPGNFLESSRCSRNYSKMVLMDSLTNSTLFRGQDCQNLTHRSDLMSKVVRKQISLYLETLISSHMANF